MSQYKIEYAKSNRAGCRKCSDTIDKDAPRIGKLVPSDKFDGEFYVWFHVPCFFEKHTTTKDDLQGFSMIRPSDQAQVLKYISSTQPKKRTNDDATLEQEEQKKQKTEDPKQLKKLWDYIDMCKTICTGSEIQDILEHNLQSTRGSFQELAYRVADGLLNGGVPPCPDCKNKTLVCEDGKYRCYGDATAWSKCNFQCDLENSSIRRTSWNSPKWFTQRMKEHFDVKSGRSSYSSSSNNSNNNSSISFTPVNENEIFDGITFCLIGKFSKPRGLVIKDLKKYGAIIAMNNNLDSVDFVITDSTSAAAAMPGASASDDVDSESVSVIQEANQKGIPVLKEEFLWDSIEQKRKQKPSQYKFSTKVSKPKSVPVSNPFTMNFLPQTLLNNTGNNSDDDTSSSSVLTSPQSNPFHGRTVEDADPYFKDNNIPAQVHKDRKNNLYSTILNRTDISVGLRGLNSFYEIQALENTQKKLFYLFKRWGRVGTPGSFKCIEYATLDLLLEAFKETFSDKTGNKWEDRDRFVKKPNKFYPVGADIHLEKEQRVSKYMEVSKSTNPRVANLVSLIFDLNLMKKTLAQLDVDLAKMPLGKLTKSQIKDGYACLTEIQDTLGKPNTRAKILELTNKFYTLIPQDFGSKRPPMIDSADVVQDKTSLLETLGNIQIALGMLESDSDDNSGVIDSSYAKLCTKLTPLEKSTSLYQTLEKYATQPSGWINIQVLEIFLVEREGEHQRYSSWQHNRNRKLLWHGSGLANYVGILSQGLRIAPPEAPVSGYRFGKGVYFADIVSTSKSAGYCRASPDQPEALMLLNEVALGNMYETTEDEYMEQPPPGFDSTKAVGNHSPDPAFDTLMDDGVVIPLGAAIDNNELETSCYDNEYIIYDVSQVKIRFLLKVKMY